MSAATAGDDNATLFDPFEGCVCAEDLRDDIQKIKSNDASLTELRWVYHGVGVSRAKELAAALRVNETLAKIDLYDNIMGNDGVKELAAALQVNKTLTQIDLYNNSIGNNGAKELVAMLAENLTITQLDLYGNNDVNPITITQLDTMAATNKTLEKHMGKTKTPLYFFTLKIPQPHHSPPAMYKRTRSGPPKHGKQSTGGMEASSSLCSTV